MTDSLEKQQKVVHTLLKVWACLAPEEIEVNGYSIELFNHGEEYEYTFDVERLWFNEAVEYKVEYKLLGHLVSCLRNREWEWSLKVVERFYISNIEIDGVHYIGDNDSLWLSLLEMYCKALLVNLVLRQCQYLRLRKYH